MHCPVSEIFKAARPVLAVETSPLIFDLAPNRANVDKDSHCPLSSSVETIAQSMAATEGHIVSPQDEALLLPPQAYLRPMKGWRLWATILAYAFISFP